MKKTLLGLGAFTILLVACGGGNTPSTNSSDATTATVASEPKPAMDPGELLIVKSDCIGCHNKEEKIIGPSYIEVAAKYPATDENIIYLAEKILKGGKGVWGTIPMTPHPKLTQDEAKLMSKYILSLRK